MYRDWNPDSVIKLRSVSEMEGVAAEKAALLPFVKPTKLVF
jgi:hypothetical protein